MRIAWGFLIIVLLMASCKYYNLPKGFPDVEKMADILVEIQLAESTIAQGSSTSGANRQDAPSYFKFVLDKHGYTAEEFDSIRKWYVYHPELYLKVYDRMLVKLSKEDAQVKARSEKEREIEKKEKKRLEEERKAKNLWRDSTYLVVLPTDTIDKRMPFTIPVDTLMLKGELEFSASYKFMKEDVSEDPIVILSAIYSDLDTDSVFKKVPHSFSERSVHLTLALRDTIHPNRIEGFLMYQDSTIQSDVQIRDIYLENKVDTLKLNKKQ